MEAAPWTSSGAAAGCSACWPSVPLPRHPWNGRAGRISATAAATAPPTLSTIHYAPRTALTQSDITQLFTGDYFVFGSRKWLPPADRWRSPGQIRSTRAILDVFTAQRTTGVVFRALKRNKQVHTRSVQGVKSGKGESISSALWNVFKTNRTALSTKIRTGRVPFDGGSDDWYFND